MKWKQYTGYQISDCGTYKITNEGKKGGNRYCLWTKAYGSYCRMLKMGSLEECRERAER